MTIFQPGSPLHDGAVILQEDRVAAAACFLPLTVNPRVSRELGTRHRAAIGLTEENDAVAVVVSEETGQISLALDGRIERGLTRRRAARAAARRWSCSGERDGGRRARPTTSSATLDGLSPFPASRAEGARDRAGDAAVADGRRRAHRRAQHARAARVPEHPAAARDRRAIRRRPSTCGCAGRRRCSAGSSRAKIVAVLDLAAARPGSRLFHLRNDEVRAPYGVEVAQVAARPRLRSSSRSRPRARCRSCRPSTASRRRGSSSARRTAEPATVEVSGPESRLRAA